MRDTIDLYSKSIKSAVYVNNYCHYYYYHNYCAVIIATIHRLLQSAISELLDLRIIFRNYYTSFQNISYRDVVTIAFEVGRLPSQRWRRLYRIIIIAPLFILYRAYAAIYFYSVHVLYACVTSFVKKKMSALHVSSRRTRNASPDDPQRRGKLDTRLLPFVYYILSLFRTDVSP